MRTFWTVIGAVVMGYGFLGCVTVEPTPAARAIRLVREQSLVAQCRFVGEVKGGQGAPIIGAVEHTIDNARTRIREDAVRSGANMVLITQQTANVYGTWLHGEAYVCPGQ